MAIVNQTALLEDLTKLRDRLLKDLEELDSIIETLEIMSDEELMKSIERGLKDVVWFQNAEEVIDVFITSVYEFGVLALPF